MRQFSDKRWGAGLKLVILHQELYKLLTNLEELRRANLLIGTPIRVDLSITALSFATFTFLSFAMTSKILTSAKLLGRERVYFCRYQ